MKKQRSLGEKVKAVRKAKKLTQIDLAKAAQISQPYIAQIENQARVNLSMAMLKRLAKALKVKVGKLVE